MIQVEIYTEDNKGTVTYYPQTKEVMITHPDALVRSRIRKYLTTERYFSIGMGDGTMSEHALVIGTPTDNASNMDMALCELLTHTGVRVNWSKPDTSPQIQGDTGTLQSIQGDEEYYTIN